MNKLATQKATGSQFLGTSHAAVRQGDVLIRKVSSFYGIPVNATRRPTNVLAEGEKTGHSHVVEGDAEILERNGTLYLRVKGDTARIVHQEHAPIEIPKGEYAVTIQHEFDEREKTRQVTD